MNRCFLGLLLFMGPALALAAEPPKTSAKLPRTPIACDLMLLAPAPPGVGETDSTVVGDIDGDGKPELITNAMYCKTPGLYAYKPGADPTQPWKKQLIQTGLHLEGTAAGDLEGKGPMDLVCGPYWFSPPAAGPFSGQAWRQHKFAPGFRDWCRAAVIDVNGDRRLDIVLAEDEYPDGHLSWFENRVGVDVQHPWLEHPIESRLIFAHTLQAWRNAKTQAVSVLVAGYHNRTHSEIFEAPDNPTSPWTRRVLADIPYGEEMVACDLDGDGKPEIVAAEHDPFKPYQSRCRLFVYKLADPKGTAWFRYMLDDRFEQHCGAKAVEIAPRKFGILGHGWMESRYVHLWRPD